MGAGVMAGMGGGGAGRTAWLARRSWVVLRGQGWVIGISKLPCAQTAQTSTNMRKHCANVFVFAHYMHKHAQTCANLRKPKAMFAQMAVFAKKMSFAQTCANIAQTLRKHCTNLHKPAQTYTCANIAQTLRKHCASIAQALRKHCANIAQTLRKHCANIVQTLRKHCANLRKTAQTLKLAQEDTCFTN